MLKMFKDIKGKKNRHPVKIKDVIFAPQNKIIRLKDKIWRIEISKKKINNFILTYKKILIFGGTLGFIFIFAVYSFLISKAETTYFYPAIALGGWENYQNAQGIPDLDPTASQEINSEDFNLDNSAVLRDVAGQIFLGNFEGSLSEDAQIQRAVLRINWTFKEKTQAQPIEGINEEFPVITPGLEIEPTPSPTEEIISNPIFIPELPLEITPEITPSLIIEPTIEPTPILELTPTLTPEATSEPIIESTPISWWEKIIYKALAQEVSSTPASIIEPTIEPTPILELTPTLTLEATSEPIIESTPEIIEESPTESVVPELTLEATPESTSEPTVAPAENLIEISYSLDGMIWNVLTKVNRENWKNLNLEIPNFKTSDLQNLQISFQSLPIVDQDREVYLDGVVLEIEYETPLQSPEPTLEMTPEIKQEKELAFFNHATEFDINNEPELFLAKPLSGSWMERVEMFFQESTQVQEAKLIFQDEQEIPVHLVFQEEDGNYRIRIRKPDNLMEGQYTFQIKLAKYDDVYKASTVFTWKTIYIPQKILSFSLAGESVPTKKILEWHPKSWQLLKNSENNSIGIKLEKPQKNEGINGYSEIILSGACREEYFVILAFKNINDYEKNPGGAILNKASACENGRYYYKINELSAVFETGVYYLLVAEEDKSNPWKPISALQPIQVKIEYK